MDLAEIDALTVEDVLDILLFRLVDFSGIDKEIQFVFADAAPTKYENLILNSKLTKPHIADFEAELLIYKEELRFKLGQAEIARLEAEKKEAEIEAFTERTNAIVDIHQCMRHIGITASNLAIIEAHMLRDLDYELLELLEAATPEVIAEMQAVGEEDALLKLGREYRQVCQDVLDLVTGYNRYITRPGTEVDTLQGKYSSIEKALKDNRPITAKALLDAAPDDEFLTNNVRIKLTRIFSRIL